MRKPCLSIIVALIVLSIVLLIGCDNRSTADCSEYHSEGKVASHVIEEETVIPIQMYNPTYQVRYEEEVFLLENLNQMESLANTMILAAKQDGVIYNYTIKDNRLEWVKIDSSNYHSYGQLEKHPILDETEFLLDSEVFDYIATEDDSGVYTCVFTKVLFDSTGWPEYNSIIIYNPNEGFLMDQEHVDHYEEIVSGWYFYLESIPDGPEG